MMGQTSLIVSSVAGAFVVSFIYWDLVRNRKIFGGTVPRTLTKEWSEATAWKMDNGWPTVANSKPVVLNPLTRKNYRIVSPILGRDVPGEKGWDRYTKV